MRKQRRKTRPVRVRADLAAMLAAIAEVDGTDIAAVLDPLIREAVERGYAAIKDRHEAITAIKTQYRGAVA